ncbi:MAG: MMPL family transporter [Bacteroidales bacterium]|nr:MMPL family transporter [Bacteroidales bacterium]
MVILAVVCGLMIPRLNIIMEISYFLPDDSPIKLGMDKVSESFPDMDNQLSLLSVMFETPIEKEAVMKELNGLTGGMACLSVKEKENYTLFEFLLSKGCDYRSIEKDIEARYGDDVVVEVSLDKNMPANIIPMIATGTVIVFLILLVMCASVVEVFLFSFSMLMAVAINMGSNILMPGVSFVTNTLTAVIQIILSMDYSIFLMNRFRQEKLTISDSELAMRNAIKGASPSILSSALTTIVSLLMLVFMHLKIGQDLGFVLAKGVLLSMICTFTLLPGLILEFEKSVFKSSKKVPHLPSAALARFEIRFRLPLALMLVGIFVAAFILQKRTEISFAAIWPTEIGDVFPPENPCLLVYDTSEEDAIAGILDTLERDKHIQSCLSYPSLMLQGFTVPEMSERIKQYTDEVDEELLKIVYYAKAHPERDERLSLNEIQDLAEELGKQGLVPPELNAEKLAAKLMPKAPAPARKPVVPAPAAPAVAADTSGSKSALTDSTASVTPADSSLLAAALHDSTATARPDSLATPGQGAEASRPATPDNLNDIKVTYELATRQMTAKEMSDIMGLDRSYFNMVFRMAGRTRKPATMSPHELSTFVTENILTQKRYAYMLTKEQADQIREAHRQLDSAFIAGPSVTDSPATLLAQADSLGAPSDTTAALIAAADSLSGLPPHTGVEVAAEPEPEPVVTPLERLAEMAFSGKRYSSRRVRNALAAAGIPVSQDDMDLLYLYAGSRKGYDPEMRMSLGDLARFVDETLLGDPKFARFITEEQREMLAGLHTQLEDGAGMLRSDKMSLAALMTDYPFESPESFAFVERFKALANRSLQKEHFIIGESFMYKEIKDGFPNEMLLLTVLTILAIFLIVALTFKSFVIPTLLIFAVMSGVYVNVFVSGLGGNTMYFLAYLIVQSILMGATIDYSILFTSYYREHRRFTDVPGAISEAYLGAGHSIMTSGLILTLGPFVMSMCIKDQLVEMILRCLGTGALASLFIIIFVLPGTIAICDKLIAPKGSVKSFGNKKK